MPKSPKKKSGLNAKNRKAIQASIIHYSYCLAIIILLILISLNINNFLEKRKVLGTSINVTPIQEEKAYWDNIVKNNPTYIDAYLQLAKVDVELGMRTEATSYIEKALVLNPNSIKIIEVERELGL